jgi:GNAT superfamily N-acetyltransferase
VSVAERFQVREAQPEDAPVIAWHRARMFQDMGELPDPVFESLRAQAEVVLGEWLERGEYRGWLASPSDAPATIVAGAGVQLRQVLPHPARGAKVAAGRHATVLNVFTEPAWRRQGLGELLMRRVLEWAAAERLDRLVLHASAEGRALYKRLGFVATNEMRFRGSFAAGSGS